MSSRSSASHVLAAALLVASVSISGCSSKSGDAASVDPSSDPLPCKEGVNAAFANPAGTPFTLPAGIELEGGEMTNDLAADCPNDGYFEFGSTLMTLCMRLRNTGSTPVTVVLPAGLVFVAKNPVAMNGMILQSHELKVPANGVKSFFGRPFSTNKNCGYYHRDDRYTFGNVVSDAKVAELVALAKTKSLAGNSQAHEVLQPSLRDITDGSGLTAEDRGQIMMVPDVAK
jgi:hypothetical protein